MQHYKMTLRIVGLSVLSLLYCSSASAQKLEFGLETSTGISYSTFNGDLAEMVGFSELEVAESEVDSAFAFFDVDAPRWIKNLFPGLRIEVDQQIARRQRRNTRMARFFVRYRFLGASVAVSDPRFVDQSESKKLKNQVKSVRLAMQGEAEALSTHLAALALADLGRPEPFFPNRYDLEVHVHLKKLLFGNDPLLQFGRQKQHAVDVEVVSGLRLSADPSPAVDLGSVLFISEKLDSLMEGGLLAPVEETTDQVAEALQNILFGKFRDPRTVPALGWFARVSVPVQFGNSFSVVAGADLGLSRHTVVNGTQPMFLSYAHVGIRWRTGFGWKGR
jgi:hypothetical protein